VSDGPPAGHGNRLASRERGRRSWFANGSAEADRASVEAWRAEADERHATGRRHLDERLARQGTAELPPGISVVIVASGEEDDLASCLESLAQQTLDRDHFEVIVLLPSASNPTFKALRTSTPEQATLAARVIRLDEASHHWAREAGISATRRAFTTFLDDRDEVSSIYLEVLFAHANPRAILVATLARASEPADAPLANGLRTLSAPQDIGAATAEWGGKLIVTQVAKEVVSNTDDAAAEASVFWMSAALRGHLRFETGPACNQADYRQAARPTRSASFDQDVERPLAALASIEAMARGDAIAMELTRGPMAVQGSHIGDWVREHPGEHGRVVAALDRTPAFEVPYGLINRGMPRGLAIVYAFPPYADTSAVVSAKRIRERGRVVDVVYNAMDSIRSTDDTLRRISGPFVGDETAVHTPTYFSNWRSMESFAVEGMKVIRSWQADKDSYDWLYSRAHFAASHFLAAAYKLANPTVAWTAEFSDPLSRDIHGTVRGTPIDEHEFIQSLRRGMSAMGLPTPRSPNSFVWAEELAYVLADELIFTNQNQMDYMLSYCANPEIAAVAQEKAAIAPQPTLPSVFYSMVDREYQLDGRLANLAYFGNFYETRGLDDVLAALAGLAPSARARVCVHVFTVKPRELEQRAAYFGVAGSVRARPYVPFLEFLNLTTKFDCLLVNDAVTSTAHGRNPYLPSKWADYRGSGTPVWGLVELGSPLSAQSLDHESTLGDVGAASSVLAEIAQKVSRGI
jgi:hypothetical protein